MFETDFESILKKVQQVRPVKYGKTRNFIDGAVTRLSPYISRGVISTKYVYEQTLKRGFKPWQIEKFIQELAWRDYWQQVWIEKGSEINTDLRHAQQDVTHYQIPKAILEAQTGIEAIDEAIKIFYKTGYIHNHIRMYIASLACNMGKSYWKLPAQWMYFHLLDADWASNALSWQWVAGANSNKKYVANQKNINKFCYTNQCDTFLDVEYEAFENWQVPTILQETISPQLQTNLPETKPLKVNTDWPVILYNFYNLDPNWKKSIKANRILILEPKHFAQYPVSKKTLEFVLALAENIPEIQVYSGSFEDLVKIYNIENIYYKEHPLSRHYKGIEEPRSWMFPVSGYYRSFFAYWKRCKKYLPK